MGGFGGLPLRVHRDDQSARRCSGRVAESQDPVIGPDKIRQYPQPQEIFDKDNANENDLLPAGACQRTPQGEIPFAAAYR
jgi:hypothetical protein